MENSKRVIFNKKYWKGWSSGWNIFSILAVVVALVENLLVASSESVDNGPYRIFLLIFIFYLLFVYLVGYFFSSRVKFYSGHFAQLNISLGILLCVQDLLTEKFGTLALPYFVSFAQILEQMRYDALLLLESTISSLVLWLISFVIGALIGVVLGILLGRYRQFNYWSFPYLKVIGIIPAAAWMPLTMVVFPNSFLAEVFLIVLSVWFPVAFMTIGGVQGILPTYFEAAYTLGFSEHRIIQKIVIPGALPNIFIGIFTSLGLSFTMLVISEMIGAKVGLGWYINWAKSTGNYSQLYGAIVIMALLFSIIFALINKIQEKVLRWRQMAS
ncbi:ABC transporter permease [Liquorilactobacillus mali]|uniref:Aliphatic sulfonates transport permease ssuC n=1 Tax=Liquorilactobacillus mali KCTC 3596 = DSM 20444 TaxID=1046596 RepID=J0UPH2_9LACO|nr:ABC transporter permease subunit [Liquorilactobacillus mali]EJE97487.1 aliphatic sulfonates transport permease ssuC [Liquorilactobacillus mali KCTC 3596 = DSM 20444]KRN08879.1 aliphatic sulfonates transport permease ssuC [Liquorilactobacillus mali KCTC 3596 = DSM 20444]MDV7758557.1 ABC transporter permease subunit [Liquorilactobacillus mali]QFQ75123.1 ABC transporter permease subunit [Liquorilactobacillus mali]